ncbi:hypothetical protein KEM54_000491 [Ascosphaera aggregata]|nr:hypothetical protein KEM54_000491 [Ascosphaera aggregata]
MAIFPIISTSQANLTPERVRAIAAWSHEAGQSLYVDDDEDYDHHDNHDGGGHDDDGEVFAGQVATSSTGLGGVPLDIHFDIDDFDSFVGHQTDQGQVFGVKHRATAAAAASFHRRKDACLRESKRREALLKGKEGSRRRQRWENSQLLNNPWAQPPEPTDWDITPTAPKREIPYHLASLWDTHYAQVASKSQGSAKRSDGDSESSIPRKLRLKLKHARAARGLLMDIEGSIRSFIEDYHMIGNSQGGSSRCSMSRSASSSFPSSSSSSSSSSSLPCADSDIASCSKTTKVASAASQSTFESVDSDGFVIVEDGGWVASKGMTTTVEVSSEKNHKASMIMDHRMIFSGSVEDQTASFA